MRAIRSILSLMATACVCTSALGGTITTKLNGLEIGVDETNGAIVRLAYPDVGTILESSAESAGLLDVAYPIKPFVPLRLGSRYSKAQITKADDGGITIVWSPLGASRTNFPMPKGNVEAHVTLRAADDRRSVILTCVIENKSDALVPQILFPDLRGLKAIDGPAATQLRFAAKAVYPFTEDPIPPDTAPWYVNSGWKEYPPAYGMYGINALRWLDFGGYSGGLSLFQKAWGAAERPIVRTYRSQADPSSLRIVWDYKAGVKSGARWQSDEIWLTPHRGGWAKGIEVYRDYARTKHPQRQPPPHIRDGLGFQTAWLIQTPETDPAYAAFTFKDIPRIAADAKAHGIDELNLWGWCEYFDLPIRVRSELGTTDDLVDAIKKSRELGVHVSPFVSVCCLQNKLADRYGGKPGGPAWVYHPDNVPLMDPYYLAASYPIQYWNIFTPDRTNKNFHDDVTATFKQWMDRGVTSWSWDQVFADAPGSAGLTDLLLGVRKMIRAKDSDAAFSGEQLVNLEFDAGALDYTWNWQDYVDAAPIVNVFRTPRLNCNIEDSPRVVKMAFADNLYLNAFPRKPDQPNGTALISEKPALAAALKQVAALRKQFLPYFVEGTNLGDSVVSEACPAFVRGYQLNDKLLVIVLNDGKEAKSLTLASDLALWLGTASTKYIVRRFDSAGKLLETADQVGTRSSVKISDLPPLDLAIFEIVKAPK